MHIPSKKIIRKPIAELNSTNNQLLRIVIYRPFHSVTEYTLFSNSQRTFIQIHHVLDHKVQFNKNFNIVLKDLAKAINQRMN